MEGATTCFSDLPPSLITDILLLVDTGTLLNVRLASSVIRPYASALIAELIAKQGSLPAEAWQVFTAAWRLRLAYKFVSLEQYWAYLDDMILALDTLPPRIKTLSWSQDCSQPSFTSNSSRFIAFSRRFADRLVQSACSSNLEELVMQPSITTAAADYLLQHLTSLRSVQLDVVESDKRIWKPAADLRHLDGSMQLDSTIDVDCSGLSSAAKLKQLTLRTESRVYIWHNLAAISSLTSLHKLGFIDPYNLDQSDDIPATWGSLQQLRTLQAPQMVCLAEAWRALAGLPLLETFHVGRLDMDASAPAAAALREVRTDDDLRLLHSPQQLPGCLVRQLPALQVLKDVRNHFEERQKLAAGLAGHPQLLTLKLLNTGWPTPLASQLPALQKAVVPGDDWVSAMADVAQAGQLQCLRLDDHSSVGLEDVLAALAGSPASNKLREVKVLGPGTEEEVLVGLLGTLPQLFPQMRVIKGNVLLSEGSLVPDYDAEPEDASRCKAAQMHLQAVLQGSAAGQAWSVVEVCEVSPETECNCICKRVQ